MRNSIGHRSRSALGIFTGALLTASVASAQSNCQLGPPATAADGAADITQTFLEPCAISSDPANCANPGSERNVALWNHALLAAGNLEDELVVVLPGGGQDPENLEWVARAAAYAGYRTIGLTYEGDSLDDACGSLAGPDHSECVRLFRRDVLLGDRTPFPGVTDVHPANAVQQRLVDLVGHLDTTFPGDGWGAFLNGDTVEAGNIIIAGYSLGSGHAAFWARIRNFAGVVTLSGPTDSSCSEFPHDRTLHPGLFFPLGCTTTLAGWIRDETHETPGDVRYAAFHAEEALYRKLDALIRVWDQFGIPRLPGPQLTLDVTDGYDFASQTPWPLAAGEHRFSFNTPVPGTCSGHQAAAADGCLELDPGSNLPMVFPTYMQLFCAAGHDLP
jgi:hypothetical protein